MRKVVTQSALSRLKKLQEDNMPYKANILSPPSTEATTNGQPSKIPITVAANVRCRVSPIRYEEGVRLAAGQVTAIPTVRIIFPLNTPIKAIHTIELLDHPDLKKLKVLSKVPRHPNSTAETVYCSV
jgi:hypothetical protein